jgi:hypothetical protein
MEKFKKSDIIDLIREDDNVANVLADLILKARTPGAKDKKPRKKKKVLVTPGTPGTPVKEIAKKPKSEFAKWRDYETDSRTYYGD